LQPILEDVDPLDRLVHEPARLIILTALASCASADFVSHIVCPRRFSNRQTRCLPRRDEVRSHRAHRCYTRRSPPPLRYICECPSVAGALLECVPTEAARFRAVLESSRVDGKGSSVCWPSFRAGA
jgi:hypothetical protein